MFLDFTQSAKPNDFTSCLAGIKRLQEPHYRQAWKNFREQISLSDYDFDLYYTTTLSAFADYTQNLPASRFVFYGHAGGFLQLGFERAIIATQLAIKAYHDFEGLSHDQLGALAQAELFAVFTAALLADMNFLTKRFQIKAKDEAGQIKPYDPYQGAVSAQGKWYTYDFHNPELYGWGGPASVVLAEHLLSKTQPKYTDSAFSWISHHYDVLQLWYSMILGLSPTSDTSTRQRYLISLIPEIETDMIRELLLHLHKQDSFASRQHNALFVPEENELDDIAHAQQDEHEMVVDPISQSRREFEKVLGGGGPADASNTHILGSLGASLPPLAFGLGFLGWLIQQATKGKLWGLGGGKIPAAFRSSDSNHLIFDVDKLLNDYAREKRKTALTPAELVNALKETQLLKDHHVELNNYSLATLGGKHLFAGIQLPIAFIGVSSLPPISLGLLIEPKTANNPVSSAPTASPLFIHRHSPIF